MSLNQPIQSFTRANNWVCHWQVRKVSNRQAPKKTKSSFLHPWTPSLFFCGTSEEVAGFFLVSLQQLRKLDEVPPLSCPVCVLTPHSVHAFSRNTIDWYFPKKSIPGNENFQVNNIFSLPLLPFFGWVYHSFLSPLHSSLYAPLLTRKSLRGWFQSAATNVWQMMQHPHTHSSLEMRWGFDRIVIFNHPPGVESM